MKITSCRLECTAFKPGDEPKARLREVVFLGRSNVGKSSLINRLLGEKGLARTSSQPGRTQSVNFYRVNEAFFFVDLPGYGYARVPAAVRASWQPMVQGYLERHRDRIALGILLVDARHEPSRMDIAMRDWLEAEEISYVVTATKSDKLSGNGRAKAARVLARTIGEAPRGKPLLVSAISGLGLRQVWGNVDQALEVSTA